MGLFEDSLTVVEITDYAQKQLHEIVYVEIRKDGTDIEQFKQMGTMESIKSVSDIFSPVTGKISKVNMELRNSPELLNQDSCGKGWLAKITFDTLRKEMQNLLSAKQYAYHIKSLEE
jgi:glycine cleavage system H protein